MLERDVKELADGDSGGYEENQHGQLGAEMTAVRRNIHVLLVK